MTNLLTGGTGKTSKRLADLLLGAKIPFLLASRKAESSAPSGMPAARFDWLDSETFEIPFKHPSLTNEKGSGISAVYLIAPEIPDPVLPMQAFIDLAVHRYGVKRFVMLTGSSVEKGGVNVGPVWEYLSKMEGVKYHVLRATWFMEQFSEQQHLNSIREEGKIYTACRDGRIPFVSAADIAAVAFRLLVDNDKSFEEEYRILGQELLNHDEVAEKFSSVLGREIRHVKLAPEEKVQKLLKMGIPEPPARFLIMLEVDSAGGSEEREGDAVEKVTGRKPQRFEEWMAENKGVWL